MREGKERDYALLGAARAVLIDLDQSLLRQRAESTICRKRRNLGCTRTPALPADSA